MNTQQQQDLARILAVDEVQKKLKQPEILKAMSIKECLDFARSYEISFPVACDLLRTLSAENAALRAGQDWRPIETAPLDTEILLYDDRSGQRTIGSFPQVNPIIKSLFSDWKPLGYPMEAPAQATAGEVTE